MSESLASYRARQIARLVASQAPIKRRAFWADKLASDSDMAVSDIIRLHKQGHHDDLRALYNERF